jgi:CBS domain containing-hemolysin-like protein
VNPTALQAATPFMTNIALIVVISVISLWIRTRVEGLYEEEYRARKVTQFSLVYPGRQADLALWAIDLSTLFSTVAVTTAAAAVMLQGSGDPSLEVIAAFVVTLVLFGVAITRISPLKYNWEPKNRYRGAPYPIWMIGMVVVPNLLLTAYSFIRY